MQKNIIKDKKINVKEREFNKASAWLLHNIYCPDKGKRKRMYKRITEVNINKVASLQLMTQSRYQIQKLISFV